MRWVAFLAYDRTGCFPLVISEKRDTPDWPKLRLAGLGAFPSDEHDGEHAARQTHGRAPLLRQGGPRDHAGRRESRTGAAVAPPERAQKTGTSLKVVRRLQRIERLPEPRQRVVLRFIDALIDQEMGTAHRDQN